MKTALFPAIAAAVIAALVGASALAEGSRSERAETSSSRRSTDTREEREHERDHDGAREAPSERAASTRSSDDKPRAQREAEPAHAASEDGEHDARGAHDADAPRPSAEEPSEHPAPSTPGKSRSWLAQSTSEPVDAAAAEPSGASTGLTIGAVVLLLGLAAAAIAMRFRKQTASPITVSESRLNVLSSSRVGPKAYAVTALVNGRVLLLGVTDHNVTNLGWLDTPTADADVKVEEPEEQDDELPDDYPGSALRASKPPPQFASSSNLKRFQEVLRGAEEARQELPLRPSYVPPPPDAAAMLAAQTTDVVSSTQTRSPGPVSLRRKRRTRDSIPPRAPERSAPASSRAPRSGDPSLEGQVAGLRALRNGN